MIVGIDNEENELGTLELIQYVVETLDTYFGNVCELDLMYHIDKVNMIIDEIILDGCIIEGNQSYVLKPIYMLDKISAEQV